MSKAVSLMLFTVLMECWDVPHRRCLRGAELELAAPRE